MNAQAKKTLLTGLKGKAYRHIAALMDLEIELRDCDFKMEANNLARILAKLHAWKERGVYP